jgi:hypothetical protein
MRLISVTTAFHLYCSSLTGAEQAIQDAYVRRSVVVDLSHHSLPLVLLKPDRREGQDGQYRMQNVRGAEGLSLCFYGFPLVLLKP